MVTFSLDFINHQNQYNELADVVSSSDYVKSHPKFDSVLLAIGEMLVRHQLNEVIGVRLLHRHNELHNNEYMIEAAGTLADGRDALITTRRMLESSPVEFVPVIWKCLENGEVIPLEFCEKAVVSLEADFFVKNKIFFAEFFEAISTHGLERHLGLCLLVKSALLHDKATHLMVENIDETAVANVVTLKARATFDSSNAIETVWDYSAARRQYCYPQVCVFCTDRSPGHEISRHRWHECPSCD